MQLVNFMKHGRYSQQIDRKSEDEFWGNSHIPRLSPHPFSPQFDLVSKLKTIKNRRAKCDKSVNDVNHVRHNVATVQAVNHHWKF